MDLAIQRHGRHMLASGWQRRQFLPYSGHRVIRLVSVHVHNVASSYSVNPVAKPSYGHRATRGRKRRELFPDIGRDIISVEARYSLYTPPDKYADRIDLSSSA